MYRNHANAISEIMDAANAAYAVAAEIVGDDAPLMQAFIMGAIRELVVKYAHDHTAIVDGNAYIGIYWSVDDKTPTLYPLSRTQQLEAA